MKPAISFPFSFDFSLKSQPNFLVVPLEFTVGRPRGSLDSLFFHRNINKCRRFSKIRTLESRRRGDSTLAPSGSFRSFIPPFSSIRSSIFFPLRLRFGLGPILPSFTGFVRLSRLDEPFFMNRSKSGRRYFVCYFFKVFF